MVRLLLAIALRVRLVRTACSPVCQPRLDFALPVTTAHLGRSLQLQLAASAVMCAPLVRIVCKGRCRTVLLVLLDTSIPPSECRRVFRALLVKSARALETLRMAL
jgi:hypothetical protein